MSDIILEVDYHEKKVIDLLGSDTNIIVKQLDVGDFIFKSTDPTKVPFLLLERKTYEDLANSIHTKRYDNQKIRILESSLADCKGYIIEGQYPTTLNVGSISLEAINSTIMSAQIRDKLIVINSQSVEHTAKILRKLMSKLPYTKSGGSRQDYLSTIKSAKKDNMTPDMCYQSQLAQIPGVSTRIAIKIWDHFPNMVLLIDILRKPNGWKEVASIDMGGRKIGNVLAQRIVDYILPHTPAEKKIKIEIINKT